MENDTFARLQAMAREVLAARMRLEGLDPTLPSDWTEYLRRLTLRIAARDQANRLTAEAKKG